MGPLEVGPKAIMYSSIPSHFTLIFLYLTRNNDSELGAANRPVPCSTREPAGFPIHSATT